MTSRTHATLYLSVFLCTLILAVTTARGSAPVAEEIGKLREHVNDVRAGKCLGRFRFTWRPSYRMPVEVRVANLAMWRRRHRRAHEKSSRCISRLDAIWLRIASCESGQRWTYNGPSGFDGGLQFLPSTWNMAKGFVPGASAYAYAYQAPASVQIAVADAWRRRTSWAQWPACARSLGLL
jgi:transglycosylase-like protein